MEQWFAPITPTLPPHASRVLVLAPHPDDEVFGCGGLLYLYRLQDIYVHVEVLTDGAGYQPVEDRQAIFDVRQAESRNALTVLNVDSVGFMGYADRSLCTRTDLKDRIKEKIKSHCADVVLAPSLWEIHPDHLATARASVGAVMELHRSAEIQLKLLFYEVGAPQRGEILIDISSVWTKKLLAMQCFASQNAVQSYSRHIEALNIYRTYTLPSAVEHAEMYSVFSPQVNIESISSDVDLLRSVMDKWVELALVAATAQVETLSSCMATTQRHSGHLHEQIGSLREQCHRLQELVTQLQTELNSSKYDHRMLLESKSWRATAPFRALKRWVSFIKRIV